MQIFDLRFNPKLKEDQTFGGFIYEPESAYEKKLGSIYMTGHLKNALPGNIKFLDGLSEIIKKNYYKISFQKPEKALKECLKKTNFYLGEELKKDNVNWLGNLSFVTLCIKDLELNFTKTGDHKIILIRDGQINDIGKGLDNQEIDPYPLKVFFSVVSGKVAENDIILALTKEVWRFFQSQGTLNKIALSSEIDSKKIKEIFPAELFSKGEGSKMSGSCFMIVVKKNPSSQKNYLNNIIFEKIEKGLSLPEIKKLSALISKKVKILSQWKSKFLTFINAVCKLPKKITKKTKTVVKEFRKPSKIFKDLFSKKKFDKLSIKSFALFFKNFRQKPDARRGLTLVTLLFILILIGSFIFHAASQMKEKSDNKDTENAKQATEQKLLEENNLEKMDSPQVFLELEKEKIDFIPEKILLFNNNFYYYSPLSPNLYELNLQNKTGVLYEAPGNISGASSLSGSLLFFSEPDTIFSFEKNSWRENKIQAVESNNNSPLFFSYASNLYFFNDQCEIIKYPCVGGLKWGDPQKWLKNEIQENFCQGGKSMTIDNSIWILNGNSISRYYGGYQQETINFNIYPREENITKLETKNTLPYFYLLDPPNNRLIALEKDGKIFKQIQSDKFNDLKDFVVSGDGKIIWLLNGLTIYQIEL